MSLRRMRMSALEIKKTKRELRCERVNMSEIFTANLSWLPAGEPFSYKSYTRQYLVKSPGKPDFIGTAAPTYFGSHYHYNPEDMLVISLSACHMLSYLALASNSKIQVLSYQDAAVGELATENKITKYKEVILKQVVKIAKDSDFTKAQELHKKAHHICFIANSVNFPVLVQPTINT